MWIRWLPRLELNNFYLFISQPKEIMMNLKKDLKKALTVLLGIILANSSALAAPTVKLLQGKTYANGAEFCQSTSTGTMSTCIPVYNNSDSNLYVTFQDKSLLPGPLSPHLVAVFYDNGSQPGTMVTVYQKKSDSPHSLNIIFSGFAHNNVGVTCNTESCSDWE
jgi:hypothetical protein